MNDNCLGELHLLADALFKNYVVMIYYVNILCEYII